MPSYNSQTVSLRSTATPCLSFTHPSSTPLTTRGFHISQESSASQRPLSTPVHTHPTPTPTAALHSQLRSLDSSQLNILLQPHLVPIACRTSFVMSLDWTHQFCLACDKQTDGTTYCSQSCRLADYEKTSSTSSRPSSPALNNSFSSWTFSNPTTTSRVMYLPPAYDFSRPRPSGTSSPQLLINAQAASQAPTSSSRLLSPSNSHASLCSMRSNSSAESNQLSDRATRELQAYARSFESVRLQRRRSH